jgi:tryptophanyl-tRNA synthetase
MKKKIILTGDRPTGPLHIGHLFGSLLTRAKVQKDYETYIMVADVQALTDNFNSPAKVRENVLEVVMDNLAAGIDPKISTIFIQSLIPEIAELTVFFSNLVTLARLERNPTVKAEIEQKKDLFGKGVTYGFLGYPVSQAADILTFLAEAVPVGEDQLPMIEQTREIARKFNNIYGETFPEPRAIVGQYPRIRGLDGNAKMSKSLDNAIYLKDTEEITGAKVMKAVTDPQKIRKGDKGNPEVCVVYSYHEIFSKDQLAEINKKCRSGELGCVDCKKMLAENINDFLKPIREKRSYYEKHPAEVKKIVNQGNKKALARAEKTMALVRKKMQIDYDL